MLFLMFHASRCPRFYKSLIPKYDSVRRTSWVDLRRHVRNILGKDDTKATRLARQHNSTITYRGTDHERVHVPVDVAVEEPRAGVVREEPDRDIITGVADAHDVAEDRIIVVVRSVTSAAYNSKGMSMQMNGMLFGERVIQIGEILSPYANAEYSQVRRR
jgi:hypothetical protein